MCASALPGKNGTHEIGVHMSKKTSKNIPDVIDCNFKNDDQILIVFGTSISDRTSHQMMVQVPTSPYFSFCTTCRKTSETCVEINKENVNKMHLSGSVTPNSPDFNPLTIFLRFYATASLSDAV